MAMDRGGLWMIDNRSNASDFPELTESGLRPADLRPASHRPDLSGQGGPRDPSGAGARRRLRTGALRAPVVFGSDRNAMQLDEAWVGRRVARLPRYVFGVLTQHADELLDNLENSQDPSAAGSRAC